MKLLMDLIDELKKAHNIERYHFEPKEIHFDGQYYCGKVLKLCTIPTKFPVENIQLSLAIGRLRQMNYGVVRITKYGHKYDIDLKPRQVGSEMSKEYSLGKCKDCKDGYYYPLIGKREPCETCT